MVILLERLHGMGYKKLSSEQELQLIEEYKSGISVTSLCEKYGFATKKSITDKIKKYYPEQYDLIVDEARRNRKSYNFRLDIIDSEFDAYYLGLMLTDGYVTIKHDIGIDLIDEDCIQFLSKSIGKNYAKYDKLYSSEYNRKIISQKHPKYRLLLNDQDLEKDLARFGVVPNKTKTLTAVSLLKEEEKFIPYIIRGIIDGDGTVNPTTYGAPQFRIVTYTDDFAQWIKYVLEEKMFMSDIHIRYKNPLYEIGSAEKTNLLKLIALSYNKPFGMNRKYNELRETFRDYNKNFFD